MALQTVTITSSGGWIVPSKAYILRVFMVGGGGGGGWNGGGGGGGGRVLLTSGYTVVPGQSISVTIGTGGSAGTSTAVGGTGNPTIFGALTVNGGTGGNNNGGNGGASSQLIFGSSASYSGGTGNGNSGAGGAGASGNGGNSLGNGSFGYNFLGTFYGGGGGGGCGTFDSATSRPLPVGIGGAGGGGKGGSELTTGTTGSANTGGGGGGGARGGTLASRTAGVANAWTSVFTAAAAQNGGVGGTGVVVIQYDDAVATITGLGSGMAEGNSLTFNVTTQNIQNGATLTYTMSGAGLLSADFSPASLTGTFTVVSTDSGLSGTASFTITASNDGAITEGEDLVTIQVSNGVTNLASTVFRIGDLYQFALANVTSKKIQIADFNNVYNKVNAVLGTGSGNSGYGITLQSSAVSTSTKVRITDWNNLKYDIINAYYHQTGTTPTLPLPLVNDVVRGSKTDYPYALYDTWADAITAQKFNIAVSQSTTRSLQSVSTTWPGSYASNWNSKTFASVVVYWSSSDNARYFFNAGGELRFSSSRTGGTSTYASQNSAWTNLLAGCGTIGFGGNKPIADVGAANAGNFYRLTNSFQVWYTATATNPYSSNTFRISARTPGVANNSAGSASSIEFYLEWVDGHASISGSPDGVDGTLSLSISTLEPTGILQPAAAGLFDVETPAVAIVQTITPDTNAPYIVISPSTTSPTESGTVTFSLSGADIPNGSYNYNIVGAGITPSDFSDSAVTGSLTISGNSGTLTKTLRADETSEGSEQFYLEILSGVTSLAVSPIISITDSSTTPPYVFTQTISADTADYNVQQAALTAGWNGLLPLRATITINAGIYVYASTRTEYGFRTGTSSFPAASTVTIVNRGYIIGKGGNGGNGQNSTGGAAVSGQNGGTALYANVATSITNLGGIYGGGGGGSGSTNVNVSTSGLDGLFGAPQQYRYGGSGGGGGRGSNFSIGGGAGAATTAPGAAGGNGGISGPGGGGSAYNVGGSGGNWGSAGTDGQGIGGQFGAAGFSVEGNAFITWLAVGDRRGDITP